MRLEPEFLSKYWKIVITAFIVFTVSSGILFVFKENIAGKTFFVLLSFVASYYSYHNIKKEDWTNISKGVLIGLAAIMFMLLIILTVKAAVSTGEWDFMCFYMQGLLGVHNLDFYDPNSFNTILKNLDFQYTFSDGFYLDILNVGLLYPPITMLLFVPLSSLDPGTSRLILSILVCIFILVDAFLANIVFVRKERSVYSLLFIFIIIMLLPGTSSTIEYSQTNFFLLFFLMLMMLKINKSSSGLYLALSTVVKPISGFLILFFLIGKKWKSIIYFFATVTLLFILTGFIWGFHNIISYFESPPTQRLPQYLYEHDHNQSLIALFNRNLKVLGFAPKIIRLLYYVVSCTLVGFTIIASNRLNSINKYLSFFPYLLCMLMIYPSSLIYYMVYILPILIYFILLKKGEKYFWALLIPALCFTRTEVFFTYLILWIGLLFISLLIKSDNVEERTNLNLL